MTGSLNVNTFYLSRLESFGLLFVSYSRLILFFMYCKEVGFFQSTLNVVFYKYHQCSISAINDDSHFEVDHSLIVKIA